MDGSVAAPGVIPKCTTYSYASPAKWLRSCGDRAGRPADADSGFCAWALTRQGACEDPWFIFILGGVHDSPEY